MPNPNISMPNGHAYIHDKNFRIKLVISRTELNKGRIWSDLEARIISDFNLCSDYVLP